MLLERNQAVIGLIMTIFVIVGTVLAVGATGGFFVPGERFEAEFTDAAGLGEGNFVFVAGVRVGQVTSVELMPDRVRVEFSSTGPGFPDDSTADIIIANTLGKRAIRINVGASANSLPPGGLITLDRTGQPIDIPELGDRSAELLTELDVAKLQELTTALADVADGSREDLSRLLVGLEDVSQILVDRRTDLEKLLTEGTVLIDAVGDADQDIVRIIDAFGSTLDRLSGRRSDVQRLLSETVDVTDTANDLLIDRKEQLNDILDDLHTDLAIIDAHQGDLSHVFAYMGVGLEGFSSIGYTGIEAKADNEYADGSGGWGNVFLTDLGPVGVDALFGCGGTFDQAFTALIGPDPRCSAVVNSTSAASDDVIRIAVDPAPARRARVGSFFDLGGTR